LPSAATDPRVAFTDGAFLAGFHYHGESWEANISVQCTAAMAEKGLLAVRLRQARAGSLPLPVTQVVEEVNSGAATLRWPIKWTEIEGDPVALIPMRDLLSTPTEARQLEQVDFREGELHLAGSTAPRLNEQATAEGIRQALRLRCFWWGNPDRDRRTRAMLEAYSKRTGTQIAAESLGWGDYWTKLGTQTAGGNAPDLIQMDYRYIFEYARRRALKPLESAAQFDQRVCLGRCVGGPERKRRRGQRRQGRQ
jgi:hypothetical protein